LRLPLFSGGFNDRPVYYGHTGGRSVGRNERRLADYPNIHRWINAMAERSVVIRGRTAEKLAIPQKYPNRKQRQSPEEWSNMFGETMHNAVKA
jgi:hypothetical protein